MFSLVPNEITYTAFDVSFYKCTEENQLDTTEWYIARIICSTCFGHVCAHHQELETILVLLPHMVCNALVVGVWRSGAGQQQPATPYAATTHV